MNLLSIVRGLIKRGMRGEAYEEKDIAELV